MRPRFPETESSYPPEPGAWRLPPDDPRWWRSEARRFGLPAKCLYWAADHFKGANGRHERTAFTGRLVLRDIAAWLPDWELPVGIRWFGLLVNTAVYGGAAFFMLWWPGALRRSKRRRAGQCAWCGYDLRRVPAGVACPECGAEREQATSDE